MNVLLVYPEFPASYWGYDYMLGLVGKKAAMPPLGLITVAALCPQDWSFELVDLNIRKLRDAELRWADMVFVSGMIVQHASMLEVLRRARRLNRRTVVGGPHATSSPQLFENLADHLVLDEGESSLPPFLADLAKGNAKVMYRAVDNKPDVTQSPMPRYDLLALGAYGQMCVQFSRGCPFNCEFCDIIVLYGRKPRTKTAPQLLAEFDRLRELGWRSGVFLVDDNFIGNKTNVKNLLPWIEAWQKRHGYPFDLYTEASMNLAHEDQMLRGMVEAGFNKVFIGIETPSIAALEETQKVQNTIGDPLEAVLTIQRHGLEVMGGFIIGFDSDGEEIFEAQKEYIRKAHVPLAMIGLLAALPDTQLWKRLAREGRLLSDSSGDQFGTTNFDTKMAPETLLTGYRDLLAHVYDPDSYFERVYQLIAQLEQPQVPRSHLRMGFAEKTMLSLVGCWLAVFSRYRKPVRAFLSRVRRDHPGRIYLALWRALMGFHFFEYTRRNVLKQLDQALVSMRAAGASKPGPPAARVAPLRELVDLGAGKGAARRRN